MPKNTTNEAKSVLVVGFKDTKEVLTVVFGLAKAYEQIKADGKVDWNDVQFILPVLFSIGPAIENFENVQIELKMSTKEEGEELKAWINANVDLENKTVEEFIEASFAIVLDIWYVFRTFLFPAGVSKLVKTPAVGVRDSGKNAMKTEDGGKEISING